MNILTGVVAGWLGRRALELGGLIGSLAAAYLALPEQQQALIGSILTGNWQGVTLGALIPFVVYVFSQVLSFRATVKDQVVSSGKKVDLKELPSSTKTMVEEKVETVVAKKRRQPSLLERLFGRRT